MPEPLLSAILAMDQNQLIGNRGALPWHLPADLQHFKKITLNHVVIMGRKTFSSIGKPLPQRVNIVLTQDRSFQRADCLIAHTKEEALTLAKQNDNEIFIIGGNEIYKLFMNDIQKLYITEIHQQFPGDTHFEWNKNDWRETQRVNYDADEKNAYAYSFVIYERR